MTTTVARTRNIVELHRVILSLEAPKLLYIKNYVNKLTNDELTTGYYQQDCAKCHTSNASMREIERFFFSRQNYLKGTFGHPDLPI